MDYRRFNIGTNVQADSAMTVAYDAEGHKKIYKALGPVCGMIVGLKRFMLGNYEGSGYIGGSGCSEPELEEAYLNVTESVVVWVIKEGMLNKPVYALDEDVVGAWGPKELPLLHQNQPEWDARDRQIQREAVANAPRNSRGRWIKGAICHDSR